MNAITAVITLFAALLIAVAILLFSTVGWVVASTFLISVIVMGFAIPLWAASAVLPQSPQD